MLEVFVQKDYLSKIEYRLGCGARSKVMKRTPKVLSRISVGIGRRSVGAIKVAAKTSVAMLRSSENEQSDIRWEQISSELGRMKGLMMKMGQMASYIEGTLPPEAQPFLAKLQHQSDPLPFEVVEQVLVKALGRPATELFDHFEPEALAAASIGQVHRAIVDGQPVAVKIQYPEIRQALSDDLKTAGRLTRLGMLIAPGGGKELVMELRTRFLEECDYEREAAYLQLFGRLVEPIPGASVPGVILDRCSTTVLTMNFVEGLSFDLFREQAGQAERDHAAEILARFVWNSIFKHGIFNADPHPGNYLFQENGDITFLDFGCVKQFDEPRMQVWKGFARSVLEGDKASFKQWSLNMGLVGRERNFDWDSHWRLVHYLYQPFLTDNFEYTSEYIHKVYEMHTQNIDVRRAKLPADMLFTNRLQFGFNSILSKLGGRANWKAIFHEAVYSDYEPVVVEYTEGIN